MFGGAAGVGVFIFFVVFFIISSADHVSDGGKLLFVQGIQDVLDGLVVRVVGIRGIRGIGRVVRIVTIRMLKGIPERDYYFVIYLMYVTIGVMDDHIVNLCFWVGAGQHETYHSDVTERDDPAAILQINSIDGHRVHVAMSNSRTSVLCALSIVEVAVGLNAICTILQDSMTKN